MAIPITPQINLLEGRSEQLKRERLVSAKVQFALMVVLACYIGLLAAVLSIKGVVTFQVNKTNENIGKEELALAKLKPIEEKYFMVVNKLELLTGYFNARGKAREMLLRIYQTLPPGVQLASVTVGGDEDSIGISAIAPDMNVMIAYLNLIEQEVKDGIYRQVSVSGIGRGKDGLYAISSSYLLNR